MGSKMMIAIILGMLAMLLLISSEVAARDLREGEVVRETNQVGDAKTLDLGGFFGIGPGVFGPYFGGGFGGYIPRRGGFFGGRPGFFYPGGPGFGIDGPGYPGFGPDFGFGGPGVFPGLG